MKGWFSARASAIAAFVLVALFSASTAAFAQGSANIQGTVTDSATQRPVVGAQVAIAGTTRGTVTDDAGRYAIRAIAPGQYVLRVVRLGYGASERRVAVAANETVDANFALRPVAAVLSEVVVTGYGTSSRAELSSAVAQVTADAIVGAPVAGLDAALQGKAPGVQVVQNAGNPGNGISVRVRGSSSLSATNQPLYVIDGVPMQSGDLSQLGFGGQDLTSVTGVSPDEIETIDILKDAAASAIYGARAANGVVQITTKRGAPGKTRFTLSSYYGSQTRAKKLGLLNAQQYVMLFNEAAENDGYGPNALYTPGVDDVINTDWQDEVMRTAPIQDHALSISGGSDRLAYMLAGTLFDQTGIIIGSDYKRGTGRLNVDFAASDKASFRSSFSVSRELWHRIINDNTIIGPGANAIALQPILPVRRANGEYADNSVEGLEYANPVALGLEWKSPATSFRVIGGVDAMYDLTSTLRLTARLGTDVNSFRERQWQSPYAPDTYAASVNGVAQQGTNMSSRVLAEGFGTYEALRSQSQKLSVTAGGGLERNREERTFVRSEVFASNFTQYPISGGRPITSDGDATGYNLVSGFARANYNLLDRYLFTGSFRVDGSSRFGRNSRFGYFPSASFGWNATDESFMEPMKRIGDLKLRASFGVTGNQGIGSNFAYLGSFGRSAFAGEAGTAPSNFENADLKWEQTTEFDVGFDMSFLQGRVALIGDYYTKKTNDLLIQRPVTSTSGYTSVWDNVGNIENKGVELQLNTTPFQAQSPGGFDWSMDFNIAHNKNTVTKLHRGEPFEVGFAARVQEGQPLSAFYMIKFLGVDPQTGDAMFFDADGDGDTSDDADDRIIVGSPHPDYFGGIRNTFSFKGFDLGSFIEFSQGFEILNGIREYADDGIWFNDNKLSHVLKRWRQPGDVTDVPRLSWDGTSGSTVYSSRYLEDGSYWRLQEVTLGYTLPKSWSSRGGLSNTRLYVTGRNLKVWTDFLGYDPDANSGGSGSNTTLATEFYSYPRARTISVGLNASW